MKNKNIDLALGSEGAPGADKRGVTPGADKRGVTPGADKRGVTPGADKLGVTTDAETPPTSFPVLTLPADPKVREVLENGFLFLGRNRRGQDEYEYVRTSRAGNPLTGAEAKKPPRYKVTAWGQLACFCSCPYHTQPGTPDKHVEALGWWLSQKGAF